MVPGFQDLQNRGVGLGLGGVVGPGDPLQLAAGGHVGRLGERAAGQRRRDEVHHIGGVDAKSEIRQQRRVVADQRRIGPEVGLHRIPLQNVLRVGLGFRLAALRRPHLHPPY